MYTEPTIVYNPKQDSRAYVKLFINDQRYRFYNGKLLEIYCFSTNVKILRKKLQLLKHLHTN